MKYVIGVDEAGRGPLAGPLTLAAFLAPENLRNKLIKIIGGKIKDSKQFSPNKRYTIYREFLVLKKSGKISFFVSHISNKIIDKIGISKSTQIGINKSLKKNLTDYPDFHDRVFLVNCKYLEIRLDGLLKAPEEYKNQKTIIKGDEKDVFIACASIVAKVRRDRLMCRLAKKYPQYDLEIHKGYGTALHYKFLKKFGLSKIHRKSFCKNLTISIK